MNLQHPFRKLIQRIHQEEEGAVSLETILIIGAIALPILIWILKYGWPKIKNYFTSGMDSMENQGTNVQNSQ